MIDTWHHDAGLACRCWTGDSKKHTEGAWVWAFKKLRIIGWEPKGTPANKALLSPRLYEDLLGPYYFKRWVAWERGVSLRFSWTFTDKGTRVRMKSLRWMNCEIGRRSAIHKDPRESCCKIIYTPEIWRRYKSCTMARFEFPRNPSILGIFVGVFHLIFKWTHGSTSMVPWFLTNHRSIELLSRISPFFADGFPSSLPRERPPLDGCHIRKKWLCSGGLLYAFRWLPVAN